MRLINPQQQQNVSDAISKVEALTDAELVVVLAARSDNYRYIPLLWAAMLALLTPALLLLTPFWLVTTEIFLLQWLVFVVIALLFSIPVITIRLIPKSVRYWRAANMARRQFLENNLHYTKGETGVLIFISEAERYVEIIADRGINNKVDHEHWQTIVNALIAAIKKGDTQQGIIHCIERCGELLAMHVSATESKDELPNRLVILN